MVQNAMWWQIVNMCLGLWLMASPGVLGYGPPVATSDHVVGPLVATFACTAIWEATRSLRWVNLPLGVWAVIGPLLLGGPNAAVINSVACGVIIAVVATRGGAIEQRFGGGWSMLWRSST
jgi:hypothetical protein